jgi:hypothetical protein
MYLSERGGLYIGLFMFFIWFGAGFISEYFVFKSIKD